MLRPVNDRRELIWDALDAGDIKKAVELASRLNPRQDDGEGHLLVAIVDLEAGRFRSAYNALKSQVITLRREYESLAEQKPLK